MDGWLSGKVDEPPASDEPGWFCPVFSPRDQVGRSSSGYFLDIGIIPSFRGIKLSTKPGVHHLALDELGYVHLDQRAAELLFQILTEREERASIAIASNSPFSKWGKTFTDTRLAAIIDRVTYRAHIIETGTSSYRLAAASSTPK